MKVLDFVKLGGPAITLVSVSVFLGRPPTARCGATTLERVHCVRQSRRHLADHSVARRDITSAHAHSSPGSDRNRYVVVWVHQKMLDGPHRFPICPKPLWETWSA